MITAEHAMEFGRDVFAVPGPVTDPLSHVPLQLIRDGATLIRDADDLLQDLGLEASDPAVDAGRLSETELGLLRHLTGPTLPEISASRLGVPVSEVLAALMELELRGFVRSAGGRFDATLKGARARAQAAEAPAAEA